MAAERTFPDRVLVTRALISVYDKQDLAELARGLRQHGVELVSSGGTFKALEEAGIEALPLSAITGETEWISGRVKTLHPKVHAGILALRGPHDEELAAEGIPPIDLVVVNLYPFSSVIADPGTDLARALEIASCC